MFKKLLSFLACFSFLMNLQAAQEKIIICGICRNVDHALSWMKKNVEDLGSHFDDYRVVIYENNSTDRTVQMLNDWTQENAKVLFKSEHLDHFSAARTENIANARNSLLTFIKELSLDDYKILVMADFDFHCDWPIEEMLKSIACPMEWDAICANGLYSLSEPFYWDRYAFRCQECPYGPEVLGDSWWWNDIYNRIYFDMNSDEYVPVFSAFGGLTIYKTEAVLQCSYTGLVTDELKTFYQNNTGSEISFVGNTYWEHPSDPHVVTCCEHVNFYALMKMHGFDKVFVNPKMVIRYN